MEAIERCAEAQAANDELQVCVCVCVRAPARSYMYSLCARQTLPHLATRSHEAGLEASSIGKVQCELC